MADVTPRLLAHGRALSRGCRRITSDSRAAAPAIAFAAYPGDARDGRAFIARCDRARRRRGAVGGARLRLGRRLARAARRRRRSQGAARLHRGRRLRPARRARCGWSASPAPTARRRARTGSRRRSTRCGRRAAVVGTLGNGFVGALAAGVATRRPTPCVLHELLAQWLRDGARRRRDGGVVARPRPGPRQRRRVRRRAVHQPDARSPRLPRHDGARTAQPRRGSSQWPGLRAAVDQRRRRVRTQR